MNNIRIINLSDLANMITGLPLLAGHAVSDNLKEAREQIERIKGAATGGDDKDLSFEDKSFSFDDLQKALFGQAPAAQKAWLEGPSHEEVFEEPKCGVSADCTNMASASITLHLHGPKDQVGYVLEELRVVLKEEVAYLKGFAYPDVQVSTNISLHTIQ